MPRSQDDEDRPESALDIKREFRGSFADDADAAEARWVLLCALPPAQAESLCHTLEAAAIPCEMREASASVAAGEPQAVVGHTLDVHVLEEDLEVAQEIASGAAFPAEEEDDEDPAEREQRRLDNWICPGCDRQELELLPLSRRRYHLITTFLVILLMPFVLKIVVWATADPQFARSVDRQTDWLVWPWMVALFGMAFAVVAPNRDKRCKACGWNSIAPTPNPPGPHG